MNRDESLLRPRARPPEVFTCDGRTALYPTERTGGSWVGVNDAGLAVALINWYAVARVPGSGGVSRGIVVPLLLAASGVGEVRETIAALPRDGMAPFRALIFAQRERMVREFRWDQRTLAELPHAWEAQHWFSSGCDESRAQRERGRIARAASRKPRAGSLPWLRRLHASHEPASGPFCFCMHREDAATVSYTEVEVNGRAATMRYYDGPPCNAPEPEMTYRIFLQTACKESVLRPTNQQIGHSHESSQLPFQPSRCPPLPRGVSSRCQARAITR